MIRLLRENELASALKLIWKVFLEYEAPDYSEQGVKTFQMYIEESAMIQRVDQGEMKFWGAFESGELAGVIGVKHGKHISMLFVDPAYHRKGIATALVAQAFADYQGTITVNSSPFAIPFYHRIGFQNQANEQVIDGIRFTPMKMEK